MASLARAFAVGARHPVLVAEAAVLLVSLRLGLSILTFATTRRWLDQRWSPARRLPDGPRDGDTIQRVGAIVSGVSRRLPFGTTCLVEALAAEAMLRRRGFVPALRIGVREPGSGAPPLDAHAWVECADAVVIGGQRDLGAYVAFPGPGTREPQ